MSRTAIHARIPDFPFAVSLQGARLDNLHQETVRGHNGLVLDYHQFVTGGPTELFRRDGRVKEQPKGMYVPRRLRFTGIEELEISGAYSNLDGLPMEHPAREIHDMLRWIQTGHKLTFYLLVNSAQEPADLHFYARKAIQEDRSGEPIVTSFARDWSSPPPTRTGLIPHTKKLYERFGGDPVTININGRTLQRNLFVGGLENQSQERPAVNAVLNLGEHPSRWAGDNKSFPKDRWAEKGEGLQGMSPEEIRSEAEWVADQLKAEKRVLVHCASGMNRSSTICCAALMLLENLSAEEALERVREHHPWARPVSLAGAPLAGKFKTGK